MRPVVSIIVATSLTLIAGGLSGCTKEADDATNIVEMNASDGTMNDMTVVESDALDQASAAAENDSIADNASNAN